VVVAGTDLGVCALEPEASVLHVALSGDHIIVKFTAKGRVQEERFEECGDVLLRKRQYNESRVKMTP